MGRWYSLPPAGWFLTPDTLGHLKEDPLLDSVESLGQLRFIAHAAKARARLEEWEKHGITAGEVEGLVLGALESAYEEQGEPVTTHQVVSRWKWMEEFGDYPNPSSGRWNMLDWGDRVGKWLNRLVRKGLATKYGEGHRARWEPGEK